MSNMSKLWDLLDSIEYSTPAGEAFAWHLYKATERRLKAPIDVLNVLLSELHVYFDKKKFGRRSAERAAGDIALALTTWLKYLQAEGYISRFVMKIDLVDGARQPIVVTVETPDGARWTVEVATRGVWIKPRLLNYEVKRQLVVSQN